MSTSHDRVQGLAAAAAVALVMTREEDGDIAVLWARCLVQAAAAEGKQLPVMSVYRVRAAKWYGFHVGPITARSDCGVGLFEGRPMIRTLDRRQALAVIGPFSAALRLAGADRGDDWYFALDDDGDVIISDGGTAVTSRYGKVGEQAIVGAIRSIVERL